MRERPILFSGPMVRAILEGRKTQTRRIIKLQPDEEWFLHSSSVDEHGCVVFGDAPGTEVIIRQEVKCPYGVLGDRLWARERYAIEVEVDGEPPPHKDTRPVQWNGDEDNGITWSQAHYMATDAIPDLMCSHVSHEGRPCPNPWKSAMFMPRWASRLTLEITDVRVERVREITDADAIADGVMYQVSAKGWPRMAFHALWDSINSQRGYGWDQNPWVWVLTFKRIEEPHAQG